MSIHATARLASRDDLQAELRRLGRAFVLAARDARDADALLRRENRSRLQRRLEEYRDVSNLWAADTVALEIRALQGLAEARRRFELEAWKIEAKVRSVRANVFEARLDAAKMDELVDELRPLREALELLGETLREAYRSGVEAAHAAPSLARHKHS